MAVIASGETTVKVVGAGKGGRNQEIALVGGEGAGGRAEAMSRSAASAPTASTARRMPPARIRTRRRSRGREQQSLDADAFLADNNAYAFFQQLDDLIITGPSTTNVGDLQIVLFR